MLSYALLTPFLYNQGWGKTDNIHTADILQEAEVHILHLLMSSNFYDCRTHRVPTYPWYFPSPSSSSSSSSPRPVSNYYYNCLIYHTQASGSPQPIHFLKAHDVSSPNTDENTNTKTKTVTKTMTKTKTPRE